MMNQMICYLKYWKKFTIFILIIFNIYNQNKQNIDQRVTLDGHACETMHIYITIRVSILGKMLSFREISGMNSLMYTNYDRPIV